VPGTAHVLRVSLYLPIVEVKASPKPIQMEAKGIVLSQRGYPVTVLRKAVAPLRRSNTKARGDEQKSSQACICGTSLQHKVKSSIHYKQCPYTRRLRAETRVFTPGDLQCATGCRMRQKMAEGRVTCSDRMEEVSRGHGSRRRNEPRWSGEDSPRRRPERCSVEWFGVNGHGCQRAYSYWYYVAVAERSEMRSSLLLTHER